MGKLKDRLKQDWVRIGTDGKITQAQRASTARKKKKAGAKGKTVVANTPEARVKKLVNGGAVELKPKRKFSGKKTPRKAVARGCGIVMANRRKRTSGSVVQF